MSDADAADIILRCQKLHEYFNITCAEAKGMPDIDGKSHNLGIKLRMNASIARILEYLETLSAESTVYDIVEMSSDIVIYSDNMSQIGVVAREGVRFMMAVLFDADITIGSKFLVDREKISRIVEYAESSADVRDHLLALAEDVSEFDGIVANFRAF